MRAQNENFTHRRPRCNAREELEVHSKKNTFLPHSMLCHTLEIGTNPGMGFVLCTCIRELALALPLNIFGLGFKSVCFQLVWILSLTLVNAAVPEITCSTPAVCALSVCILIFLDLSEYSPIPGVGGWVISARKDERAWSIYKLGSFYLSLLAEAEAAGSLRGSVIEPGQLEVCGNPTNHKEHLYPYIETSAANKTQAHISM